MATRTEQNEAYKKAFILNAVPFLMDIYEKTKLGYNNVDVSKTSEKFSVPTNVVPTMVDLRILTMTGEKRTAMYHWKGGIVCNEMAGKIYDRIQLNKNTIRLNKKMVETHTNSLKTKNLVKVIGSSRGLVQDDSAIILRAMYAVHASTGGSNDGQVRTRSMILDIIKKEVNNDTFAERILNGLIDGNYIKSKNKFPNQDLNLFSWVEQIPNREHALFIKDMIKETATDDKPNRMYNFLMSLHKLQSFTQIKLRPEIRKYGLSSNDQSVITNTVLDFSGNKVTRQYRWKLSESPSMKLVEELMKKSHDYGAKYYPGNATAKTKTKTPVELNNNNMEKTKSYGVNIQTVLDYIRKNGTVNTEKVSELTGLSNHAISNVFWRLNKDGLIGKVKQGVYTSLEKTVVQSGPTSTPAMVKEIVPTPRVIKDTDKSADAKMQAMIHSLKEKRDALNAAHELSMKEINEKIRDGELILAAREKEKTFMESCSKFVFTTESYKVPHNKPAGLTTIGHNKPALLDVFATKEVITLAELKERFYPGKNTNDAGVKALMAMLYYMRKDGHIKHIDKGEYALIKK